MNEFLAALNQTLASNHNLEHKKNKKINYLTLKEKQEAQCDVTNLQEDWHYLNDYGGPLTKAMKKDIKKRLRRMKKKKLYYRFGNMDDYEAIMIITKHKGDFNEIKNEK